MQDGAPVNDIWPEPFWEHGPFRVYKDNGCLYQQTGDDDWEWIGFIGNRDAWPADRSSESHCEWLLAEWDDAGRGGHEPEARRTAYELFGTVHLN